MSEIIEPSWTLPNSFSLYLNKKRLIIPPTSHMELSLDCLKEYCTIELKSKKWHPGEDSQYRKLLLQGEQLSFGLALFPPSDNDEIRTHWFECYSNSKVYASINKDISRAKPKSLKALPEFVKTNAKLQSARYIFKKGSTMSPTPENDTSDCILFIFRLPLELNSPQTKSASFLHVSFYNGIQSIMKLSAQNIPRLKFLRNKLDAPTFSFASTIYKSSLQHHYNTDLPVIEVNQQMNELHLQSGNQPSGSIASNLLPRKFIKNDIGIMIDRNNSIINFVETNLATYDRQNRLEELTASAQMFDHQDLASFDWPVEIINPFTIDCSWHDHIAFLELKNNTDFQDIVIEKAFIRDHSLIQPPHFPLKLDVDEAIGMAFGKSTHSIGASESDSKNSIPSHFKLKELLSSQNKPFKEYNISLNNTIESQSSLQTISLGIKWYFSQSLNRNWSQIDFSLNIENEILEVRTIDEGNSDPGSSISILISNNSLHSLELYMCPLFSSAINFLQEQFDHDKHCLFPSNLVKIGLLGPGLSKVNRINLTQHKLRDNCLPTLIFWENLSKFYFVFKPSHYIE